METGIVIDKAAFRERVERISNLPTLPNLLEKFNEMIKDPSVSMDTLGRELSKDQVITSKLLKLVNSAFYGFPGRISTLTHALVLLGYDALKGLIITSSIFENLSPDAYPLWRHSIAVSLASRIIATKLSFQDREEFAVAGLLHDIGKVILHIEAPEEYRAVINHAKTGGKPLWMAESEILGFDHATIGLWICKEWTLPEKLATPIGYHHTPSDAAEHTKRVAVVSLADILVRGMGSGAEDDLPLEPADPFIEKELPLTTQLLEQLVEKIETEIESVKDLVPEDVQ
ncbi:MAG: HDOD domain-containing protein [Thermodesulfobacteriota bacterium]|nr:HDOD domain-containing protein [Thermodesulfobacteriota bacterium]